MPVTGVEYVAPTAPTAGVPVSTVRPAVVRISGIDYQVVMALPLAPTFDSGLVPIPNGMTVLTGVTVMVSALVLNNLTNQVRLVYVTNSADVAYLSAYELMPHSFLVLPFHGVPMVGIKWACPPGGVVNGQVVGYL